jgi:hypothetical protein
VNSVVYPDLHDWVVACTMLYDFLLLAQIEGTL